MAMNPFRWFRKAPNPEVERLKAQVSELQHAVELAEGRSRDLARYNDDLLKDRRSLEWQLDSAVKGLLSKFITKAQEAVAAQNWEPIVRGTVQEQVTEVCKRIDMGGKSLTQFIIEAAKSAVKGPVLVSDEKIG